MAAKDGFTAEEWESLLRAPMLASYAVAGAAPSRHEDFVREMAAVADAVLDGGRRAGGALLREVVTDIVADADDGRRGPTETISGGEIRGRALENCRAVAGLLRAKADPQEADEYKRWVIKVAHSVAAAAKEGGVFGFGGEQISAGEVTAINEIGEALDV
jgi:hypothetical protein